MLDLNYLEENLALVNANIKRACEKIGKNPSEITLVSVSKTIDEDIINESIKLGVTAIGENKVQEIQRKFDNIDPVDWHLIGHLQSNKVKYIIDKVALIHSVDNLKLASEISKRAKSHEITANVLIQINVAKEEQKSGVDTNDFYDLLNDIDKLENIKVKGLMNIAPFDLEDEEIRKYFKQMKDIFDSVKNNTYNNVEMKYLSMGMTSDYEIAIEEGANIVRVGTGIYGKRDYAK
ncbi:MAG: YggS family pyridoxal phosphate-dependent enzyme [Acidaminobacteraceae bacterium]